MQTFKKHERLAGQKITDKLFSQGKSFTFPPFRMIWLIQDQTAIYPAQVLITVSKKRIKKAVDRNLIKRRIREAYRKNKNKLYQFLDQNEIKCVFAILYISDTIESYEEVEKKIILLLLRFQSEYEKNIK
jgi:ribonuclease P protein component